MFANPLLTSFCLFTALIAGLGAGTESKLTYTVNQGSGDQTVEAVDTGNFSSSVNVADMEFGGLPSSSVGVDSFASAEIIEVPGGFQVAMRSRSTLLPSDVVSQSFFATNRASIPFQVVRSIGSGAIPLDFDFSLDGVITDTESFVNPSGMDNGFTDGSIGHTFSDGMGGQLFSGFAGAAIDQDGNVSMFSDGFDSESFNSTTMSPGVEGIDFMGSVGMMVNNGASFNLDLDLGSPIFTDGFESGDTSVWSSDFGNTFTFTLTAPDGVDVVLMVPEPAHYAAALGLAVLGLAVRQRRRRRISRSSRW